MAETSRKHFDRMYQHTTRNPSGYTVSLNADGSTIETDTHQCCHCSKHFDVVKGSGKIRGFCSKCMKVTCGAPQCNEHFSFEERMDLFEKGLINRLDATRDEVVPKHKRFILP